MKTYPFKYLELNKLTQVANNYLINSKKSFSPSIIFDSKTIKTVFEFSFKMTFGEVGAHRSHRSGGQTNRKNGELFINTFQGKLAEFGVYDAFKSFGFKNVESPDLKTWKLGKWDDTDLTICDKKINIKSTKHIGNLLLLETKDWNQDGQYLPNIELDGNGIYDYFILTRIAPDGVSIMKKYRILLSNAIEKGESYLQNIIFNTEWSFDIAGFITRYDLINAIGNGQILPQNSTLNSFTKMDAENYYVQAGDMHNPTILNSLIS